MKKTKILVTGGTGFLGAALVRKLVQLTLPVRILDNGFRSSATRLADVFDRIELIQGDIRDPSIVSEAIRGMDAVIHLAAVNGTEFFYSKPDLVLDVGVRGILNVIEGCKKHGVGELIVASSSEVYQTPKTIPSDETESLIVPDVLNPRYSYGGSKIITELLLIHQCRADFKRALLFRPHNVYGPAMGWEHVIPQLIVRAIDQNRAHPKGPLPFPIQGDGRQTRAFIHIDDMIDGIVLLLEKGEHLNIYHIGNPEETTVADLARQIVQYFGRECQLIHGALQKGSTERRCPNINKMKLLGFHPKIPLRLGLPPVIEWHITNRIQHNHLAGVSS
ncbi:MAG: NAD-dependent epimerase/dehydratase family protein [Verrucomicrobia bacterium]|nr:NAD-dependent epimerase/dehydratase family protein [Verrucomicrobiota bacterium]MBU6446645.1 NAD-dependent epimerase/dehydratase family protein [Verrucomicrobiota bacterium]MDE3047250.1 NAD-dependent epimerase/dehydratase family protein [Verrucomicrobiota bacterium]